MSEHPHLLEVVRLGHPVLRSVAEEVPEDWFGSGRLADLGDAMVRTMIEEEGVGLAAPQVAEGLRLFAYWVPETDEHPGIAPTILVNPDIRAIGDEVEEGWEGCLSIPGLRGLVPRPRRVKVKARTVDGEPVSLTADGFPCAGHSARKRSPRRRRLSRPHDQHPVPGLRAGVGAVRARSRTGEEPITPESG